MPAPRLDPVRRCLRELGDPQKAAPMVHVTGTNGKTSTTRLIEAVLRGHGVRTGMFTSPHLVDVSERICVDAVPVSDDILETVWISVAGVVKAKDARLADAGDPRLTFFEVLVVLAFAVFKHLRVQALVVEVGLGGEWDATNAADGDVAVFTPVDIDHSPLLGSTVAEIARTKAGIIKTGALVVSAAQVVEASREIERAAASKGARFAVEGTDFEVLARELGTAEQIVALRTAAGRLCRVEVALGGAYQAQNIGVAISAAEGLLASGAVMSESRQSLEFDENAVRSGLATVTNPGRFETVLTDPTVIIDAAHNPHGIAATIDAVRQIAGSCTPVVLLAVLRDKDCRAMVARLAQVAETFVITQTSSIRSMSCRELGGLVRWVAPDARIVVVPDPAEAVDRARDLAGSDGLVLATGTVTLMSSVRATRNDDSAGRCQR
ncbi:folylpolyglutamate synthase/dihydrofolate synthase family protein [Herbiconiux sp. A18JL235]|uniref:tetrahydrofolate synthase n=1 Tax=Herbiconiux sp. A18JL235 TaxID=3152363 RepID=A0AB39BMD2_9MICO